MMADARLKQQLVVAAALVVVVTAQAAVKVVAETDASLAHIVAPLAVAAAAIAVA